MIRRRRWWVVVSVGPTFPRRLDTLVQNCRFANSCSPKIARQKIAPQSVAAMMRRVTAG
jgi:tartrate dehydratase beta subunit/fumarate hydratase class I family protein